MKKIVIFGAGNIGRSFIGQLFSVSGYEVVFIDIAAPIIEELNKRGYYNVVIKAQKQEVIKVKNVRGVMATDSKKVASEIGSADIAASCVGNNALPHIIPLIAEGLKKRYQRDKDLALDIIIAINMRDASDYILKQLTDLMGKDYPINRLVGLVETSIGKMVPIMTKEEREADILQIFAEPYNTLILDGKAFKDPIPDVAGLAPKQNIKAWVDRKIFIHNLGHAVTSYLGNVYSRDFVYIYEPLGIESIHKDVRDTMLQSAAILMKQYPEEFTQKDLTEHIDDLIQRFKNKALGDTVYRVGRDLFRKLGPQDRLAGAIRLGLKNNMEIDKILYALVCGFFFRATDESGNMFDGDIKFVDDYFSKGAESVMTNVCGFSKERRRDLIEKAKMYFKEISQVYDIG